MRAVPFWKIAGSALLCACGLEGQSQTPAIPPEVLLLARVKTKLKQQFRSLPDYTCLETIQRSRTASVNRAAQHVDTIRLEVLFSGTKEMFDSPGGHNFTETNETKIVATGMVATGLFAQHLKGIFVDDNGLFTYRGEELLEGRPVARFDFVEPSLQSDYELWMNGIHEKVGLSGSFWADPASYDLLRIRIVGADMPPDLQIAQLATTIDYAPTSIGAAALILPQTAKVLLVQNSGENAFDAFEFTHCRAFRVQSAVSFDKPADQLADVLISSRPGATFSPDMPGGLPIEVELATPISDQSAVGELIEAKIRGDVKTERGALIIRDGAIAHGRIRRLDRSDAFGGFFTIGLELTEIETGGEPLRFYADLESASRIPGLEWQIVRTVNEVQKTQSGSQLPRPGIRTQPPDLRIEQTDGLRFTRETESFTVPRLPGVGIFFMRGDHFQIPAGFQMRWRTFSLSGDR